MWYVVNNTDVDIYQNDDAVVIENDDIDLEDTIDLNRVINITNDGENNE